MPRVSKASYYFALATIASSRSTCRRLSVGAVLVSRSGTILSTGYNGAPRGKPHCEDDGCLMVAGHCRRAVHAEVNAVAQAARNGVRTDGAVMYCTHRPCDDCQNVMLNAGIVDFFYIQEYGK